MGIIKNIARKILRDEIEEIKEQSKSLKNGNIELCAKIERLENELKDKRSEIMKINDGIIPLDKKMRDVEKENEILRKYYKLDEEPSDEIKLKIHIDLEINRLKEENLKLSAMMRCHTIYVPMPYIPYGYRAF